MRNFRRIIVIGAGMVLLPAWLPFLRAQNHPIITEVYTDPNGVNDGPVGRDPANVHQEYIELYLPPVGSLAPGLNKDALRLTIYEVEGDSSSSGLGLVNYRFDLPTFDLDPSNGVTSGAIQRPSSGVVVLGWVDYIGNPPTGLVGTPSTRVALINGGITSTGGSYLFIAINGSHFTGTTNFPVPTAENLIDLPGEASSGVIQNGSAAYLLVNRDAVGYVQLCDDAHSASCPAGSNPNLPNDSTGLNTPALLDGFGANDHERFDVLAQPYDAPSGDDIDLETVLPLGGAFSNLIAQIPETDRTQPVPGTANGYARKFVDVPKTTETGTSADDDPVADALDAYRQIRNNGPFYATPGQAALTTSAPEPSVALAAEQAFEVLKGTVGRPGILAANVGGNFGLNMTATTGASSNPAVATFAAGINATEILGQTFGFPSIAVTPGAGSAHGQTATVPVTVNASNSNVGDPAVVFPVKMTTASVTILNPTTGQNAAGQPFQTTVFVAVQGIPASGATNEFVNTSLGNFVSANLGGLVQDTKGNGALLVNSATNLNDGPLMQGLITDFPPPGTYVNYPGVGLDLAQTVIQSAEVVSGSGTYDESIAPSLDGVTGIRFNHPDTLVFGGSFTPSEMVHFADAQGGVASPRSGLTNATTTRTFELALMDTNTQDSGLLETGATDDFGIVVEVQDTEPGAPVVDGQLIFLSFSGGLQGADIDTLQVPPGNNVATLILLDLDNLHTVLGIRSIEQSLLIDGSGNGEVDIVEAFSLNPADIPATLLDAFPAANKTLWKSAQNVARLTFTKNLAAPLAGQVLIQQLLPGGAFGADLSSGFSLSIENDGGGNPRVLRIEDIGPADLVHRQWYGIRQIGGWAGVANFNVDYLVQIGDANNDNAVLNIDASIINAGIPNFAAPDDDRRDIDGDGRILNGDVVESNGRIPSFEVTKPSGH